MFPGAYKSKKMKDEELNEFLLHSFPNVCSKWANIQGWNVDSEMFRTTTKLFEIMKNSESIYERVTEPV